MVYFVYQILQNLIIFILIFGYYIAWKIIPFSVHCRLTNTFSEHCLFIFSCLVVTQRMLLMHKCVLFMIVILIVSFGILNSLAMLNYMNIVLYTHLNIIIQNLFSHLHMTIQRNWKLHTGSVSKYCKIDFTFQTQTSTHAVNVNWHSAFSNDTIFSFNI